MTEEQVISHLSSFYSKLYETVGYFPNSYIAGGAIASLILNDKVNDYDVWFETEEAWNYATALAVTSGKVDVIARTKFATTFKLGGEVVQFVKSRVGFYDEVVETFDFRHAQAAFLPKDDECEAELCFVGKNSIEYIECKELMFDGVLDYPTHTFSRLQKFALRGYKVSDYTLANLILAVRNAPADLIEEDIRAVGKRYNTGGGQALQYASVKGSTSQTAKSTPSFDHEELDSSIDLDDTGDWL